MPRMFVAAWPPPAVSDLLAAVPRPDLDGVRWTAAEQWHITVRYLGEVDAATAHERFARIEARAVDVDLGPRVVLLGEDVVVAPVEGLSGVAAAVAAAFAGVGAPPHPEGFRGHLTMARLRPARLDPDSPVPLVGAPVAARFAVTELALVESELAADGARYTTVARRELSA